MRFSHPVIGPRGLWGRTEWANTSGCRSQKSVTSRTQARRPRRRPIALASSAVGTARPWRRSWTEKWPMDCSLVVNDPRSCSQETKGRSFVAIGCVWRQAVAFADFMVNCSYRGRGDFSIPPMRCPALIPLLENQPRFISKANGARRAAQ